MHRFYSFFFSFLCACCLMNSIRQWISWINCNFFFLFLWRESHHIKWKGKKAENVPISISYKYQFMSITETTNSIQMIHFSYFLPQYSFHIYIIHKINEKNSIQMGFGTRPKYFSKMIPKPGRKDINSMFRLFLSHFFPSFLLYNMGSLCLFNQCYSLVSWVKIYETFFVVVAFSVYFFVSLARQIFIYLLFCWFPGFCWCEKFSHRENVYKTHFIEHIGIDAIWCSHYIVLVHFHLLLSFWNLCFCDIFSFSMKI